MKRFITYIKMLFRETESIPRIDTSPNRFRIFRISVTTPYPENDIEEFVNITGININEVEILLKRFSKLGISNLNDVNILVKLGYFSYNSQKKIYE